MTEIMMDGEPMKVGDEVYSLIGGKGKVIRFDNDEFPIVVSFNGKIGFFTKSLKRYEPDKTRDLYWQKPEIIPPLKPKKKVKVWDWFIQGTNLQCWILYGVSEVPKDVLIQITQKIDGTEREVER